jgi:hypothetical protein
MEWIGTVLVFVVAMGLCHLAMMWMMGRHGHGAKTGSSDPEIAELKRQVSELEGRLADKEKSSQFEPTNRLARS